MLEETLIFVQIVFIDIVMAADNAIIIGMVAANFAPKNRKQIIMWGVFAAFVFRVIFAFSATFLFQFAFIKLIGGGFRDFARLAHSDAKMWEDICSNNPRNIVSSLDKIITELNLLKSNIKNKKFKKLANYFNQTKLKLEKK